MGIDVAARAGRPARADDPVTAPLRIPPKLPAPTPAAGAAASDSAPVDSAPATPGRGSRRSRQSRQSRRSTDTTVLTVLVPAHDEEDGIAATVEALLGQETPDWLEVAGIVVIANNCSDGTAEVARRYPVTVIEMDHNPDKKAGALNHGWRETAGGSDLVLTMDADTVLCRDTVAQMAEEMRANPIVGGVCARYWATPGTGLVWRLQRLEYSRYDDLRELRNWRVSVVSGAAAMYRQTALEQVAQGREQGEPWDGSSLIEDYALTLELKSHGWRVAAARNAHVFTEPPSTFRDLWTQRLRWGRGGMDECLKRGWSPSTRKDVLSYLLFSASVFFRFLFVTMITLMIVHGVPLRYTLLGLAPVAIMWLERVTSMWHLPGRTGRDVALVVVVLVEDLYGFFLEACAVTAAWKCLSARRQAW